MFSKFLNWWRSTGLAAVDWPKVENEPKINGKRVDFGTPAGQRVVFAATEFEAAMDVYLVSIGESVT